MADQDVKSAETKEHISQEEPTGPAVAKAGTEPAEPDVALHVPALKVDEIKLDVDNLRARVALHASVANLVDLDVGADVSVNRVKLEIRGVEAQADLKVRLEKVYAILERTLKTIDANPAILEKLLQPAGEAVSKAVKTAEKTLPTTVQAADKAVEKTVSGTLSEAGDRVPDASTDALKESLIRSIAGNWTEDQLNRKSLPELEALTELVKSS